LIENRDLQVTQKERFCWKI